MVRKLTITVSEEVYEGLHRRIGARQISKFLDRLARPYVTDDIEALYREAAADAVREQEAAEWDALPADEELPQDEWSGSSPKIKRRK